MSQSPLVIEVINICQYSSVHAELPEIVHRLTDVGITLECVERASALCPVLVLVDSADGALAWLRGSSRVAPSFVLPGCTLSDDDVYRILAAGAADVFFGIMPAELTLLVRSVEQWYRTQRLFESPLVTKRFAGSSPVWFQALAKLLRAANSLSGAILINGETGTGKDLAAQLLHELRQPQQGEFVPVHCGAIVATLSGSELFGHKRGAFSGADRDRDGAIARASGGTLFLDEVAELSPALQTELLRVLQDGTYRPVGDDRERVSRFRLVAATHKDLRKMVDDGTFREDLYYRLRGEECVMPALRERLDDLPELALRFASAQLGESVRLDAPFLRALACLRYPGNVRELRAIVLAACSHAGDDGVLRVANLPGYVIEALAGGRLWDRAELDEVVGSALGSGIRFEEFVNSAKDAMVRGALRVANGSSREAAIKIGVTERCIQQRRRSAERPSMLSDGEPPSTLVAAS